MKLDRDLYQFGSREKRINDIPLFSKINEVMPPGTRYYVLLWSGTEKVGTDYVPDQFKVTASYETLGVKVSEDTTLHVGIYEGQNFPPRTIEDSLERSLRILEDLKRLFDKLSWRFDEFVRMQRERSRERIS